MAKRNDVEFELDGLEELGKFLKKNNLSIKVGILSSENARNESIGMNNATIGLIHEFGSDDANIQPNSFLKVPLQDELNKELKKNKMFTQAQFSKLIEKGDLPEELGEKIGAIAVGVVREAFSSNGYGKWQTKQGPNKKTGQILVDSGELRDSISYEVTQL